MRLSPYVFLVFLTVFRDLETRLLEGKDAKPVPAMVLARATGSSSQATGYVTFAICCMTLTACLFFSPLVWTFLCHHLSSLLFEPVDITIISDLH